MSYLQQYKDCFEAEGVEEGGWVRVEPLDSKNSQASLSECDLTITQSPLKSTSGSLRHPRTLGQSVLRLLLVSGVQGLTFIFVVFCIYLVTVRVAPIFSVPAPVLAPVRRSPAPSKVSPQAYNSLVSTSASEVEMIPGLLDNVRDAGQIDGVEMPESLRGFSPVRAKESSVPQTAMLDGDNVFPKKEGNVAQKVDSGVNKVLASGPYTQGWFMNCRVRIRKLNEQIKGSVPGKTQNSLLQERSGLIAAYNSNMNDRLAKVYGLIRSIKV